MRPRTRRLLLVLPAAALVTLAPLASATSAEPLWMPGMYDDADQDDVVTIVTDDGLAGPPAERVVDRLVPTIQCIDTPLGTLGQDNLSVDTLRPRSPPNS